jgi:hypothetical protein
MEEEPEEEEVVAKAKAKTGVKPVAKATSSSKPSAKAQWDSMVAENVKAGMTKPKAVMALVRSNPQLHQLMLEEVNS